MKLNYYFLFFQKMKTKKKQKQKKKKNKTKLNIFIFRSISHFLIECFIISSNQLIHVFVVLVIHFPSKKNATLKNKKIK